MNGVDAQQPGAFRLAFAVGLGGGAGALLRGWLLQTVHSQWPIPPIATISLINLVGGVLAGFLVARWARRGLERSTRHALLIPGFCGGFTTFSSFGSAESTALVAGETGLAIAGALAGLVIALAAGAIGARIGAPPLIRCYASRPVRVTLAQLNPIVGDIDGNTALIADAIDRAELDSADLVVTPELATIGYPPRDLLLRRGVAERSYAAVEQLAARCRRVVALIGFAEPWPRGPRPCRNAVAICRAGKVERVYAKRLLPTYDVFDEDRYFTPGHETAIVDVAGERVAVMICEDLWRASDVVGGRAYRDDPVVDALVQGATTIAALSASPFLAGKDARHHERLSTIAQRGTAVIAVNQVGGNDDLVFDGRSRLYAKGGAVIGRAASFAADVCTIDTANAAPIAEPASEPLDELVDAITLGIRDYLRKTGHAKALLGLSGGIDSALVAALAARAIGAANVTGVLMPSRHSSRGSIDDALDSARRLGLGGTLTVPIESGHAAMSEVLGGSGVALAGLPDENLQSRLRGVIVMAISNATGAIVLTTGNKSEYATGYATLYGDMNGGCAPIGDLLKTEVYAIARRLNADPQRFGFRGPPIPEASITKAPSAELRPDQTDQDSLPPYETLDAILRARIDHELDVDGVVERTGLDRELVARWCKAVDRMQYKRDQAAVIFKVSQRAFGRGRPMPIAMRGGG